MYDDGCKCDLHTDHVTLDISATPEGVRDALSKIVEYVDKIAPQTNSRSDIELVLAEVLNNIVEHALADAPQSDFQLTMCRAGQSIHFKTTDHGIPMPDGKIPQRDMPSVAVDRADMPEGGYGWAIFHLCARDPEYRRLASTNILRFDMEIS